MSKLQVRDLSIKYYIARKKEHQIAVNDLNLDVKEGEFLTIVGPSGCGKTTFLHAVDGLIQPSGGEILIDGKQLSAVNRNQAMVFQKASLFPWRTVMGNVVYGLELQKRNSSAELKEKGQKYIELVGLRGFEDRYPSELSGGMQQRVNLARALIMNPTLLLLDEPFAALDAQTREFMQLELLKIWEQSRVTALFVTHQINEAIYLADRVAVFSGRPGRIKKIIEVNLPRPRPLKIKRSMEFLKLEEEIWSMIEEELRNQLA